jgi:hypothetical protein
MVYILNRWSVLEYWRQATHVFGSRFLAITEANVLVEIWYDINDLCWKGQVID